MSPVVTEHEYTLRNGRGPASAPAWAFAGRLLHSTCRTAMMTVAASCVHLARCQMLQESNHCVTLLAADPACVTLQAAAAGAAAAAACGSTDRQQPAQQQLAGSKRPASSIEATGPSAAAVPVAAGQDAAAVPKGFFDDKAADNVARGIKA